MTTINIQEYRALIAQGAIVKRVKRKSPEEDIQRAVLEWVAFNRAKYPILGWMMHVPNGGKRPKGEAGKLKALGVKPGFPDLSIPLSSGRWKGLAVELKSPTGKLSPAQADWLEKLQDDGWLVGVCRTVDEAIEMMLAYAKP